MRDRLLHPLYISQGRDRFAKTYNHKKKSNVPRHLTAYHVAVVLSIHSARGHWVSQRGTNLIVNLKLQSCYGTDWIFDGKRFCVLQTCQWGRACAGQEAGLYRGRGSPQCGAIFLGGVPTPRLLCLFAPRYSRWVLYRGALPQRSSNVFSCFKSAYSVEQNP